MNLTDKNFEKEVLKSNLPVLVDFWSSWCPPCKMVEPVIDKLEKEYAGKLKVCKINVDKYPSIAAKYNIKGVPTFIIFKDGEIIFRDFGAKSENQLKRIIKMALNI